MPLPASALDSDPIAQALAAHLMDALNAAVTGEQLVKTAIAYDGWAEHLEEDFPLLMVVRGSAVGEAEAYNLTRFSCDYFLPNSKAYFARPGTFAVVGDVIRDALSRLSRAGVDGISPCVEVEGINYEAGWVQFAQRPIPGCKVSFELRGV